MIQAIKSIFVRYYIPIGKLTVVPVLLWIFVNAVLNGQGFGLLEVDPVLIALALAVNQFALIVFALRMRILLGVFGIKISQHQSLRIHLQSLFYFFVLPMTIGMEAARYAKVKNIVGDQVRGSALASALLADRLIGAVAALLLAGILFPFMSFKTVAHWDLRLLFLPFILSAVLMIVLSSHTKIRSYFNELIRLFVSRRTGLLRAMLTALCTHICFALAIYVSATGAHLEITFLQALFAITAAMLFVIIPISFAGVSPVEAAIPVILLGLGLPMHQATIFALLAYLAKLIAAFQGAAWEIYEGGEYMSRQFLREHNNDK